MITMKASVMLSALLALLLCDSAIADQPHSQPWLAVLTFICRDSAKNCIGVVLDNHWVLTNAACFWKCKVKLPIQISVYVNIPPEAQKKLKSSMDMGSEVNGTLVWQHPEYNPITFANDLALVNLGCHNHTLGKLNLDSNCSNHMNQQSNSDGYVYMTKNSIKFKAVHDKNNNVVKCFSRQGTGTLYHASVLQMVATTSKNPGCAVTLICKHSEQLKSFMQENEPHCMPSVEESFVVMSTSVKATEMPSTIQVSQTSISGGVPMPIIIPTPIQISIQISVTSVMESPVIPTSVLDLVPTPTLSTKVLVNSTQTSNKQLQISTESLIIPTSATLSSTVIGAPTMDFSSQLPAVTPTTKKSNSGCLLAIPNGEATYTEPSTGVLLITYTCNLGYQFAVGSKSLKSACVNGTMAVTPPPCELITCPPIDAESFANGTVKVSGSSLNSAATYKCNKGFILLDGFTERYCMKNGRWSGKAGFCKPVCPFPQSLICNDGQKFIPHNLKYGNVGDTVSYKVKEGYVLVGEPTVCQSNFTWSPQPECIRLCDETQAIDNATIVVQHNSAYSSYTRKITCDEGYISDGITEQYCYFGQWTPYFNECTEICDQFILDNGNVELLQEPPLQVVQVGCDEGYNLEPPKHTVIIICSNGQWMPGIPHCVKANK